MHIRTYQAADADALAAIFFQAIHQIARKYYSKEQVFAWCPQMPDPEKYHEKASDGRIFLVAADGGNAPLAYVDMEQDGHIDHLFCRPDVAGKGVASKLYDALAAEARARGISRFYVEASEPARSFFTKKNFKLVARREFSVDGVLIHNYKMTYDTSQAE